MELWITFEFEKVTKKIRYSNGIFSIVLNRIFNSVRNSVITQWINSRHITQSPSAMNWFSSTRPEALITHLVSQHWKWSEIPEMQNTNTNIIIISVCHIYNPTCQKYGPYFIDLILYTFRSFRTNDSAITWMIGLIGFSPIYRYYIWDIVVSNHLNKFVQDFCLLVFWKYVIWLNSEIFVDYA